MSKARCLKSKFCPNSLKTYVKHLENLSGFRLNKLLIDEISIEILSVFK